MRLSVEPVTCVFCALFLLALSAAAQTPAATGTNSKSLESMIPIPVTQSSHGVTFPYWENGKLKMYFNVDVMFRKDQGHLDLTNAKIETYDDNGKPDLTLLLPVSTFDLNTRVITSTQPFLVRQQGFSLVGQTLELDTTARKGKVTGKVKMLIFNLENADAKPH
jgi:hypothetical protein